MFNGELYKLSFEGPLLRCLSPAHVDNVLKEIHRGCCGNHLGGRSLAHKILRQGYYWPTVMKGAMDFTRKCWSFQLHAKIIHTPAPPMTTVSYGCQFDKWVIDIVGPMPIERGNKKWLLVAVEYLTLWVEAEALAAITEDNMIDFIWKNIIYRFGIPRVLISNNDRQFQGHKMQDWCKELKIDQFTTMTHLEANGQVEATNNTLVKSLEKMLEGIRRSWIEELPGILWAYKTIPMTLTGETPYILTYGSEVVIPAEIGMPTYHIESYNEEDALRACQMDLEVIRFTREDAYQRIQAYESMMAKAYDRRVQFRNFQVQDLVLRKVEATRHVGS